MVIAVTRLISVPGRCDGLQSLALTFTGDDDFRRLCSITFIKFQVVGLCPFFNVVKLGYRAYETEYVAHRVLTGCGCYSCKASDINPSESAADMFMRTKSP